MRWLKKLLVAIYIYMAAFFAVCLVVWIAKGEEPSALIMGISAAVGVESIAAGGIRIMENRQQQEYERERRKHEHQLEKETDQP